MEKKLREKMLALGVSDVGFCRVEDGPSGLNNAMSIVVKLSDAIIDEIQTEPTHTYFNHYRTVNFFIDQCLLQAGLELERNGYKFITVAASQSINDEGWLYRGRYSHKAIARQAGLGSIGNSCLFLHKDFGARVRLGTIFTDAPFENPAVLPPTPAQTAIYARRCARPALSAAKAGSPAWKGKNFLTRTNAPTI